MANHTSNISYYQSLKHLHKCVRCRNQDARTLIGKPLCFDCLEKKRIEMKGKDHSLSNLKSKQKCIDNGICTLCRKRNTDGIHRTCKYCRAISLTKYYNKRLELGFIKRCEAAEYNLCSRCLVRPRYKDYNICCECYQHIVNRLDVPQNRDKAKSSFQVLFNKEWYRG